MSLLQLNNARNFLKDRFVLLEESDGSIFLNNFALVQKARCSSKHVLRKKHVHCLFFSCDLFTPLCRCTDLNTEKT